MLPFSGNVRSPKRVLNGIGTLEARVRLGERTMKYEYAIKKYANDNNIVVIYIRILFSFYYRCIFEQVVE